MGGCRTLLVLVVSRCPAEAPVGDYNEPCEGDRILMLNANQQAWERVTILPYKGSRLDSGSAGAVDDHTLAMVPA